MIRQVNYHSWALGIGHWYGLFSFAYFGAWGFGVGQVLLAKSH